MSLPVDFFPKVMKVIDLLSQGRTLTSACDEAGIIATTFLKYVQSAPELIEAYDNAVQRGYDTLAEILLEIDRHEHYGSTDTKQQTVISNNIKWYLEKKRPEQYGSKVVVENRITADKAIVDALSRARDRATGAIIEDATYTVLPAPERQPVPVDDDDLSQFT